MREFSVEKTWIFGSFSRNEDTPKSDIDIAIEADNSFSYFDLARLQYELQKKINIKVDIGFIDSFKPDILDHVRPDLVLIYEKG